MKSNEFGLAWASFLNAWPANKMTEQSQAVYWEVLRDIPSNLWAAGVRRVLAECRFFPTINEIGVACCGETPEHYVTREDPWRTKQVWTEKVERVTWRENLQRILEPTQQIEGKQARLPKTTEQRPAPEKAKAMLRDLIHDLEMKQRKRGEPIPEQIEQREQRKRELQRQAREA